MSINGARIAPLVRLDQLDSGLASSVADSVATGYQLRVAGPVALGRTSGVKRLEAVASGDVQTLIGINAPEVTSAVVTVRLFDETATSNFCRLDFYSGETAGGGGSVLRHRIGCKPTEPVFFCSGDLGQFVIGNAGGLSAQAIAGVISATRGFLLPRLTTAARTALTTPIGGLAVYDTDLNKIFVAENGAWKQVTTS